MLCEAAELDCLGFPDRIRVQTRQTREPGIPRSPFRVTLCICTTTRLHPILSRTVPKPFCHLFNHLRSRCPLYALSDSSHIGLNPLPPHSSTLLYHGRTDALQPLSILTYSMKYLPYAFSRRYSVLEIPTRGKYSVRSIVFLPPNHSDSVVCPLHLDFHGGAFLGGIAEYDAPFCEAISNRTGAVVISAEYRHAPANIYPTAHEDAEDVIDWVLSNAKTKWHADPSLFTVSGGSVGANLMMLAGKRAKAAIGNCSVVCSRSSQRTDCYYLTDAADRSTSASHHRQNQNRPTSQPKILLRF